MQEEVWKDVVGFENKFSVSNFGKLKNKNTLRVLKQCLSPKGYLVVSTRPDGKYGKTKTFRMHRVVAEAFLDKPCKQLVKLCESEHWGKVIVRHKDHDKTNNNVYNLEWGSSKQNTEDSIRDGLFVYSKSGLDSPHSKLTLEDISYILSVYTPRDRRYGCRALAKFYNVSHATISRVIN